VLVSRDGAKWDLLPSGRTTTENPAGNSFGPGYTSQSTDPDGNGSAEWVTEVFDLSPYVGAQIDLRFEYITDDAITSAGWLIDDITIPALGYATDFEAEWAGWESNGWLLIDNQLPQAWLVQVLAFEQDQLTAVRRVEVDDMGQGQFDLTVGDGQHAVVAISALAPVTTQPAAYEILVEEN